MGSRLGSLGTFQGLLPHKDGQNCRLGPPEVLRKTYTQLMSNQVYVYQIIFFRNHLLCSHPHGVLSAGAFCCFATEGTNFSGVTSSIILILQFGLCPCQCLNIFLLFVNKDLSKVFPGISPHLLVLEQMFWIPFFRDLWSTTGSVAATKVSQMIQYIFNCL